MKQKPDYPKSRFWQPLILHQGTQGRDRAIYSNSYYYVEAMWHNDNKGQPCYCAIRITNTDQSAHHDWREFQRIKNEVAGDDWCGYELYPPEQHLIDNANFFMLYAVPPAAESPFLAKRGREVHDEDKTRQRRLG